MKSFFIIFIIMIIGCNAKDRFCHVPKLLMNINLMLCKIQLVIEPKLPENIQHLVSKWFNQKVKIDGFEGSMIFTITDYTEISSIVDGKKVNINYYQTSFKQTFYIRKERLYGAFLLMGL